MRKNLLKYFSLDIRSRWVYTLVQSHIRHLDGIDPEVDELAAEAIEEYDEEAPLLTSLARSADQS